jgi:excisionase family DNA binding protein
MLPSAASTSSDVGQRQRSDRSESAPPLGRGCGTILPLTHGWLSVQQAAGACGVTYRTIYRMVRWGELAAEKPDVGRIP